MTARPCCSRRARATACRTRSTNRARLASPVTGSWKAWWVSCSSKALRSVTSRPLRTMPRTCSSSSRFVARISNSRVLPSRCRSRHSVDCASSRAAGEQPLDALEVGGVHQLREAAPDHVLGPVAEHALDRRALVDDVRARVEHGDEVGRVLDERGEAGLAPAAVDLLGQDPLALRRALLLAHEAGDAGDDEREQHDRREVQDDHVVAQVVVAQQRQHRSDDRGAGQQAEPDRLQPRLAVGRRPLELDHRRVQGRRAPQQVERDPADVEPRLAVVGALQRDDAVREVGHQQRDDARRHQVEGGRAPAAVDREADRRGEQQHVGQRVGDRDELGRGSPARRRAAWGRSARPTRSPTGRAS